MGVNEINTGAATFAMKKALEMPDILIELVQNAAAAGNQPLAAEMPVTPQAPDLSVVTGKGKTLISWRDVSGR